MGLNSARRKHSIPKGGPIPLILSLLRRVREQPHGVLIHHRSSLAVASPAPSDTCEAQRPSCYHGARELIYWRIIRGFVAGHVSNVSQEATCHPQHLFLRSRFLFSMSVSRLRARIELFRPSRGTRKKSFTRPAFGKRTITSQRSPSSGEHYVVFLLSSARDRVRPLLLDFLFSDTFGTTTNIIVIVIVRPSQHQIRIAPFS